LPVLTLLAEMEKIARDTFPKSIHIENEAAKDLWNVEAAPTELHQVLMNLCVNARDAMPNGGILTLRGENVELSGDNAKKHGATEGGRTWH